MARRTRSQTRPAYSHAGGGNPVSAMRSVSGTGTLTGGGSSVSTTWWCVEEQTMHVEYMRFPFYSQIDAFDETFVSAMPAPKVYHTNLVSKAKGHYSKKKIYGTYSGTYNQPQKFLIDGTSPYGGFGVSGQVITEMPFYNRREWNASDVEYDCTVQDLHSDGGVFETWGGGVPYIKGCIDAILPHKMYTDVVKNHHNNTSALALSDHLVYGPWTSATEIANDTSGAQLTDMIDFWGSRISGDTPHVGAVQGNDCHPWIASGVTTGACSGYDIGRHDYS